MSAPGNRYYVPDTRASGGGTTAAASTGAAAAGGNMSGYAAAAMAAMQIGAGIQQAGLIRQQARITSMVNEMNAKYVEIDAYEAEKFGHTEQAAYESTIDEAVAEQRMSFVAQNVDVNYGTAAEVQAETRLIGFLNKMEIQSQARAKALGLKREAANIRLGSTMQRAQSEINASAAITQGVIGAANTGLSYYARK